jgi:hypothetical protein
VNAQDYHRQFIAQIASIPAIASSTISFREIDDNECYVKAILTFATGHELHLAEYVVIRGEQAQRTKYRYQLLTAEKEPLARWDNAPHHKEISTFPDHWHDASDQAHPSRAMSSVDAIAETCALIDQEA